MIFRLILIIRKMVGSRKLQALCFSVGAVDVAVKEIVFFSSRLDEGYKGK